MTNKKTTKIAAIIALLAIVGSVVGTGILVLVETFTSPAPEQKTLSEEEINTLFQNFSGSLTASGETQMLSGQTLTGTSN